jgi:hypothetical protein
MSQAFRNYLLALICLLLIGKHSAQADPVEVYLQEIKPVLQARCYACHGALKQAAGLRLDTAELIRQGTSDGTAIINVAEVGQSELLQRISTDDLSIRMPPEGEPLRADQISAIERWLSAGAAGPPNEEPEADPDRHWAFQTPVRPPVPVVGDPDWNRNPVDAFLAARHQELGLQPQPQQDRRLWLRRVTLDLTGLPPTASELQDFLEDSRPDAYERVVDRLLESPQYGERWGRHFMDLWRYSDWWGLGAEVRNSQKHLWHWRDWIIESLNEDRGYDQMLREMLAADELYPADLDRLRATGFLARQYFKFNRTTWLDGAIEHTSKAFLGLTFNCAKCHDHKYDPISQEDYYHFRAIFEPYQLRTDVVGHELDVERNGIPRAFDCNLTTPTYLHRRGDDRQPDESRAFEPAVPALLSNPGWQLAEVQLPAPAWYPGMQPHVVAAHRAQAMQQVEQAASKLKEARERRLAAAARAAASEAAPAPTLPPELVRDDFSVPRPELWSLTGEGWLYADGQLRQTQPGMERQALRSLQSVPDNFVAEFRYLPTGGNLWKSVGIRFGINDQQQAVLAYLSSVEGGQKAQISYEENGNPVYPPEAAQPRAVALDTPHTIRVLVRDRLINFYADGELAVAYRLPFARQPGALELITFDATAQLLSFSLRKLGDEEQLLEATGQPANDQPWPLEQLLLAEQLATAELTAGEQSLASLEARAAADEARYRNPPADNASQLIAAAVQQQLQAELAKQQAELLAAELAVLQAPADKQPAAREKVTQSQQRVAAATAALAAPPAEYLPFFGSLKTLESNLETEESRRQPFPRTSTGRRSALAHWLTHPDHPLTSRVLVNHVWARHFGSPLVPTVFDFGRKGTPPTHPELLDWLAVEFREHHWSLKHLHRLLTTSQAYRLSSSSLGADEQTLARDPQNTYYWRGNPRRMEAQAVRDSLLALAGQLDRQLGGPSIPVNNAASRRRSLYYVHSHNEHEPFLALFDDANVLECYRRAESIVPQQALALENSQLALEMSRLIVSQLSAPSQTDADFIQAAFTLILCTPPNASEMASCQQALNRWHELLLTTNPGDAAAHQQEARRQLILALLNHNDFVTIR